MSHGWNLNVSFFAMEKYFLTFCHRCASASFFIVFNSSLLAENIRVCPASVSASEEEFRPYLFDRYCPVFSGFETQFVHDAACIWSQVDRGTNFIGKPRLLEYLHMVTLLPQRDCCCKTA